MNPIQNLVSYLRRAFVEICPETDEAHTLALLKALKSSPSILGDQVIVEEDFPTASLTDAQKRLMSEPFFTKYSDAMDHLCSYSDEECRFVQDTGSVLSTLNATDVRNEAVVRSFLPTVVEYRKIENATWDPLKRDTVIQLKFELSSPAPLRLVKAPFGEVFSSLAMVVRHVGKPFQGAHMTVTNMEVVREHVSTCCYFIATFWVGPMDKFKVEIGTGFRSAHFPGVGATPDNVCRILTRGNLRGEDLKKAYEDFEEAYGDDEGQEDHLVPVLLQRKDFISLNKKKFD